MIGKKKFSPIIITEWNLKMKLNNNKNNFVTQRTIDDDVDDYYYYYYSFLITLEITTKKKTTKIVVNELRFSFQQHQAEQTNDYTIFIQCCW